MRLTKLLFAFTLVACSSSGGGGGAASCADGGVCPQGQVCGSNGSCVSPGTGGSGNSGGFGNNGGTGGGSSAICQQSCDLMATANCPLDPGKDACVSKCESSRQSTPQCIAQYDAFLGCLLTGQATCGPDGEPTVNVTPGACDAQNQAYGACVTGSGGTSGTGGTGGTGGFGGTTGGFGGTGATGGFGGTTGGFGGTGATGGSGGFGGTGGTTNGCNPAYFGKTCSQLSTGVPSCDTCAQGSCCSEVDTCLADQACAETIYCFLNSCASASDPITCLTTTCAACPPGSASLNVVSCLQSNCSGLCPGI